jgi:hypothetical protein
VISSSIWQRLSGDLNLRLALLGALLVLVGCGGTNRETGSCAAALRWNATIYFGYPIVHGQRAPEHGDALDSATIPRCSDQDSPIADSDRGPVEIVTLRGIPPQIAVARADDPQTAYLATGFLPELRAHLLHAATGIGEFRPARCHKPVALNARVVAQPTKLTSTQVQVGNSRRSQSVKFRGGAQIRGFRRAGQPYLQKGDLISVRGRYCRLVAGSGQDVFVVSLLRPATEIRSNG